MKKLTLALAALMFGQSSTAILAQSACVRHFTNRSEYTWSISGLDGSTTSHLIAPKSTAEIPYGATTTAIVISVQIPHRNFTKQFQLQPSGDCYQILSSGNPGYITLNKPTAGDVTTCAGGC